MTTIAPQWRVRDCPKGGVGPYATPSICQLVCRNAAIFELVRELLTVSSYRKDLMMISRTVQE